MEDDSVPVSFPIDLHLEAIKEGVVDDRPRAVQGNASATLEPHADCEAVLICEEQRDVEDIISATVGKAMKVQVSGS